MSNVAEELTPDTARQQLVDQLTAKGRLTRPEVAAAFLAVPRHEFAPAGTGVEAAYADDVVVTKKNAVGATSSSISAPWLQAYMLETAQLRPGSRVLEIGSGGYNAALIAELVGPTGAVTSIDIDTDVVTNARTALARAGYPQVEVALADAEGGYPDNGPYDAIIVTVETSDIPPAWTHQLAPDGLLVAPVRMRGNTRCLTLQNRGDHLAAIAALQCGFVALCRIRHNATYADLMVMPMSLCRGLVRSGTRGTRAAATLGGPGNPPSSQRQGIVGRGMACRSCQTSALDGLRRQRGRPGFVGAVLRSHQAIHQHHEGLDILVRPVSGQRPQHLVLPCVCLSKQFFTGGGVRDRGRCADPARRTPDDEILLFRVGHHPANAGLV
jgi:protein-L-isoaspartate(D-aspartate) O-methyltransferase